MEKGKGKRKKGKGKGTGTGGGGTGTGGEEGPTTERTTGPTSERKNSVCISLFSSCDTSGNYLLQLELEISFLIMTFISSYYHLSQLTTIIYYNIW